MAFTEEQLKNAQIIYQVGQSVGASTRDIQIAIMAAIVESGLRNLDYGDRDSIGMFQQRDAWGTRYARLDPHQSARMFFLGGSAGQRGLLDFGDRASMGMGEAAQAVQVSAFPDRYAEHTQAAAGILKGIPGALKGGGKGSNSITTVETTDALAQVADLDALVQQGQTTMSAAGPSVMEVNSLGEITADDAGIGALSFDGANPVIQAQTERPGWDPMAGVKMPTLDGTTTTTTTATTTGGPNSADPNLGSPLSGEQAAEGWRNQVVAQAKKMLGVPYVWGGTSYSGVDCSGLIVLLYNKMGFNLPRVSADQARSGSRVALDQLRPGDFVAWDNSSRNVGADHIAIYVGNGMVIEAPRPGTSVQLSSIYDKGNAWGVAINR